MGKVASKTCNQCLAFLHIRRKTVHLEYLELVEVPRAKLEEIQDINEEKKTNDDSSVTSSADESEFLSVFSRPIEENCEKMHDKDGFLIYAQDLSEGFLIKAQWYSTCTPQQVFDYIRIASQRKVWDKNVELIEEMPGDNQDEYLTYMRFKKMIAISQRDMMIISNVSTRSDGIIVTSRSCNHDSYPEKDGITRMQIYFAGNYYQSVETKEGYKTKIYLLTKTNFGGSAPQKFIKKATTMELPKLYRSMEKFMNEYYKSNN